MANPSVQFLSDNKVADYYYNGQYWRVKTNCRETYNDFEIVRFARSADERLGLEKDWEDFLVASTQTFRIVMDPFRRNVSLHDHTRSRAQIQN